jgi:LacI family transcriptional regulator
LTAQCPGWHDRRNRLPEEIAIATMKEVARAAEVSVATVSHVINRTRFVSPALAERVQTAMRDLGYTPDGTARSLRIRRTETIGLLVPDNRNPFFAELGQAIEEAGFAAGYTTIFGNSAERPDRERQYVETLVAKRVDGLIIAPSRDGAGVLDTLLRPSKIPVVVIDRDPELLGADVVLYDNEGGSAAATRHLLDLGHTRIAFVAGPAHLAPAAGRLEGFRRALAEAGLEPAAIVEGDFHYEGGYAAARRLLADAAPTAIFAANDLMAAGAMRALGERGMHVPDEVSVVGFDDAPLAEMVSPAVTTVRQPLHDMAHVAVTLLLERIAGIGGGPQRHVLPTELVVRSSTAPVRERSAS